MLRSSNTGKYKNASSLGVRSPRYNRETGEWENTDRLAATIVRRNANSLFSPKELRMGEPPIIWVVDDSHSHNIIKFANDFRYIKGDNYFDVFAHANYKYIEGRDSNGKIVAIRSAKQFVELMKKASIEFKRAFESDALITVKLHACNTGADTDHRGNPIISSIGQQISEQYENIIIIAPDGKVVTASGIDPNGKSESSANAHEKGVWDSHDSTPNSDGSQGAYRMFFKGKLIYEDSSVGLKPAKK